MTQFSFFQKITYLLFISLWMACQPSTTESVDAIYYNGNILTMENDSPTAQSVAVKNGKIHALGTKEDLLRYQGDSTQLIDLVGKTLLPGFIDPHSHFGMAMKLIKTSNLSAPPAGHTERIDDIITALKAQQQNTPNGNWLVGWGYDPDQLEEQRHPTKLDLDKDFPNHPVALIHVSGHMAVVNSAALVLAGMSESTPDPAGGMIVRLPNSQEPNGVVQETAWFAIQQLLPSPSPKQLVYLLEETQNFYASQGITTAQDGFTDFKSYQFLRQAAAKQQLKIDIEVLAGFPEIDSFMAQSTYRFGEDFNRLRLAGMKIVGDGSPQGKTAFFKKPYLTEVPGCAHDCRGIPTVPQAMLNFLVRVCYEKNVQVYSHANGDGAIDMLMTAHQLAIDSLNLDKNDDLRTVVIHSQFVRMDQLEQYQKFGIVPSYFSNHAFFWGDTHLKNLGEERANFLSPMQTSLEMDIPFTNHTDYIITPLNQLFTVWSAVNRTSRSGKIMGEKERISPLEAMKAITINAAYQHKTEQIKGSLKVGKIADFVILDKNPLTVKAGQIKDIQVLETIKEGKQIFELK